MAARDRLRSPGMGPPERARRSSRSPSADRDDDRVAVGHAHRPCCDDVPTGAVAEQDLELKRRQLSDRERRLRADVRMKAGELLAARRNLQIAEELLDVNRRAFSVVGNRVREGAAPTLEESLQLVEVNRLEASRQLLASRVEIATLQLKLLAGMPPNAPLAVRGELASSVPAQDRADAVRRALDSRPDLAAARTDVALARAMIRKEQAEGRWDASVNVGYMRQDFGFALHG